MRRIVVFLALAACSDPETPPDMSVEERGPYHVGTARFESGGRTFQTFYPTEATETEVTFASLESGDHATRYAELLAASDPACATRQLSVAIDAPPASGAFPLVVASHCYTCTRLNLASVSARLASHGVAVISVDHLGGTLWDLLDAQQTGLTAEALAARVADAEAALTVEHASLGSVDRSRIGSLGHSFGAVTAGKLAATDERIAATFALAAPIDSPLFPDVPLADVPLGFLVAVEDNSISEFGNEFIRDNYAAATGPAWKYELADAGHWSVSDLVGIGGTYFLPGCGNDDRQTDGAAFTYLDAALGRDITAAYVTAFFRATLDDDVGARAYLARSFPDDKIVDAVHHD